MAVYKVTLEDVDAAMFKAKGMGSLSRGIYTVCRLIEAQMDASPAEEKKKRKAEDDEDEATKPGKIEQRRKREADEAYEKYSAWVLMRQQYESETACKRHIYTTYNTREEWDVHGKEHPDGESKDWPVIIKRCVPHPDLTDELVAAAVQRGVDKHMEYEAKMKASDDAERERLKHTVRPGMPVQLRKVGEFALANLGLSRTPEEWTDELIAYVVELDFAGQNSLAGAEMYANWKRDNSEMLSRMRAEYPVNG